jgi:hypothetical protein
MDKSKSSDYFPMVEIVYSVKLHEAMTTNNLNPNLLSLPHPSSFWAKIIRMKLDFI